MNIFSNLGVHFTEGAAESISNFRPYIRHVESQVKYYAPTVFRTSVMLERVKFETQKTLNAELQNLYYQAMEKLRKKSDNLVSSQLQSRKEVLIENSQMKPRLKEQEYGVIPLTGSSGRSAYAKDAGGHIVRESLMLYYDEEETRRVSIATNHISQKTSTIETYETSTVWFADCTPQVSMSSGKNIVLTKVTGRDFSRKEIISGDDLVFNVTGEIACHTLPVVGDDGETYIQYPDDEVQKFIQIMQYPGIIKVNHFLFSQCHVDRIIIKDWSLDHPTYKNCQPYRFTCVAVEPDEDVIAGQDTIQEIDDTIRTNSGDGVLNVLMKYKLGKAAVDKATEIGSNAITGLLTYGIESIPI